MTPTTGIQKFALITFILIVILATGALLASAQDDEIPPCDFGLMFDGNPSGGMRMMGEDMPEGCLESGFYGMGMMGGMMGQMGGMGHMMDFDANTMGRFGPGTGMMGAWTPPSNLVLNDGNLSLDEAVAIAEAYVAEWESEQSLSVGEVMQFDNHFYAEAVEFETGRGAFEFLIDLQTGIVYGEPGPNMIWNLRYGMSMGRGMGMFLPTAGGDELNISVEEAVIFAQDFLDQTLAGTIVAEDTTTTFYGYYTFHIIEDGEIIGMLGVNGYTGQVWLHHWHGEFIAMTDHLE